MLLLFDLWNEIALILTTMALTAGHSATMIFQATTDLVGALIGGSIHIMLVGYHNLPIMMVLWVSLLSYQHFWVNRRARMQHCTCAARRIKS
ncbi:hypothetical protein AG1IA_01061 [Rhizoctonia solani AG-1 IA]|uniref:Uncharacterized protein n=1 Tax=Thanatephorus cucumeris (strain AG1-IA) TaxID=983506 RepID=L8X3N1_THACA|nr:hypothetical protein AG1IA_01061 [Rhizoctonia solani AG-1 IA]